MECLHASHVEEHETSNLTDYHLPFKDWLVNKARHENIPLSRGDLFIF